MKLFATLAFASVASVLSATEFPLAADRFNVLNIAPYCEGTEDVLAKEMVEYRDRTGNDVVLYCLTLAPQGYPAIDRAKRMIASYHKLREHLEGTGVRLGVLIQATLGHWPRADKIEEKWARSITLEGKTKRFCPLDPGCLDYLTTVARLLAEEKPCFILWDDDVHASGTFGVECFCERHVKKFNDANGTQYTADQLREAVKNCKPGDKICVAFEKMQRQFVADMIGAMRAAIDKVDPTIGGGACMPYREHRYAGFTSALTAAKNQPKVLRIDNSLYCYRALVPGVITIAAYTQAICDHWKDIPFLLDESDTWPHNRWSMSAVLLDLKYKLGIFNGLNGSKLWFANGHKGTFKVSRAYTDILAENRKLYSELVKSVRGTTLTGLWVPSVGGRKTWHPSWQAEAFAPGESWVKGMLGEFGIPFVCRKNGLKDEICALSTAEAVEVLSDAELKAIFAGKVLVDGAAAIAVTKRGFADLLGVKAESGKGKTPLYNYECSAADEKVRYTFNHHDEVPLLTPLAKEHEVLTRLWYESGGVVKPAPVAPGSVWAKNALGGEVVTTAFNANGHSWDVAWSEARRDWLLKLLTRLGWNGYAVLNDQDVLSLQREAKDGTTLLEVINLNFDPMKTVDLRVPKTPRRIQVLGQDGQWRDCAWAARLGGISLVHTLPCSEVAIFKIN